jgi:hypothetical protein
MIFARFKTIANCDRERIDLESNKYKAGRLAQLVRAPASHLRSGLDSEVDKIGS